VVFQEEAVVLEGNIQDAVLWGAGKLMSFRARQFPVEEPYHYAAAASAFALAAVFAERFDYVSVIHSVFVPLDR
jgi:hypothetical protein